MTIDWLQAGSVKLKALELINQPSQSPLASGVPSATTRAKTDDYDWWSSLLESGSLPSV